MTDAPPHTIQEIIRRIEQGDYDFISKLVFEGNILTYFTTKELVEFAKKPTSKFLRNILRTFILATYEYIGDFKGGWISEGYSSIHYTSDELKDMENRDDYELIDDNTYFNNIGSYTLSFNRIFESIKEANQDIYLSWLLRLLKNAEPLDMVNLIPSGLFDDIVDDRPHEFVKLLETCDKSVLKVIVMTFDYILVDEDLYQLERDFVFDRFSYLAKFLTHEAIYRLNLLYEEGDPTIREYLEKYGWHNADFDPDNYKKMDEWLE